MPIIRMTDNSAESFPEGAYCPFGPGSWNDESHRGPDNKMVVALFETHRGLCLFESEVNGRDDSDFYMVVWNPEKQCTENLMFATTRGWSYPCYASRVDATPEVIAAYEAYNAERQRQQSIRRRWAWRQEQVQTAICCGISRHELRRVRFSMNQEEFKAVCVLLKTRKFRSKFRESLAAQVRAWIADPKPKYDSPLTRKQLNALCG